MFYPEKEFCTFFSVSSRVCDEDEDVPLHQRITRSRPVVYPETIADAKPNPIYDIDEYVPLTIREIVLMVDSI